MKAYFQSKKPTLLLGGCIIAIVLVTSITFYIILFSEKSHDIEPLRDKINRFESSLAISEAIKYKSQAMSLVNQDTPSFEYPTYRDFPIPIELKSLHLAEDIRVDDNNYIEDKFTNDLKDALKIAEKLKIDSVNHDHHH